MRYRSWLVHAAAGLTLATGACNKDEPAPAANPPAKPGPAVAGDGAATGKSMGTGIGTATLTTPQPMPTRMHTAACQTFELAAIATALGIDAAQEGSSGSVERKGRPEINCGFAEAGKGHDGTILRLTISANETLDEDGAYGVPWEAIPGADPAVSVARGDQVVHAQTVARGVRVVAKVSRTGGAVDDLEPRARKVVDAVVALLPDDAVGLLRKE